MTLVEWLLPSVVLGAACPLARMAALTLLLMAAVFYGRGNFRGRFYMSGSAAADGESHVKFAALRSEFRPI